MPGSFNCSRWIFINYVSPSLQPHFYGELIPHLIFLPAGPPPDAPPPTIKLSIKHNNLTDR